MPTNPVADVTQVSINEIKTMGAVAGPCVSILLPLNTVPGQTNQNQVRFRHAIEHVEPLLHERALDRAKLSGILEDIRSYSDFDFSGRGLAIYCAPEFSRAFRVPQNVQETVLVNDHFYIKPLLPVIDSDRPFYVLALSQRHIRLLRCTEHGSEEVALPEWTPKTLWQDKGSDKPDHVQDNKMTGGPSEGSMKGVMFTTNTDAEAHMEYLSHFYKHVSEGVTALLNESNHGAPLVIAGVEYEIGCFRRVNTYPHLVDDAVRGAPDSLKGGELHRRALEAIKSFFDAPFKAALARYEELAGSERASTTVRDIVKAACDGRVLDLILAEGAQYMGIFDEARHQVKGHKQPGPGDEDLLNLAALQTISHAGQVYVVPANQVPHGAPAVAVFRY